MKKLEKILISCFFALSSFLIIFLLYFLFFEIRNNFKNDCLEWNTYNRCFIKKVCKYGTAYDKIMLYCPSKEEKLICKEELYCSKYK